MSNRIGRYELQSELGRGGFGRVYRAYDPTVGRQVAIKTLTAGGDPGLLTRFRNEAAAAGKLRHQNIVIIYDFGEYDGSPYLVMELLDGQDLEHIIAQNAPLALLKKLEIMLQVASGLQHAHQNGIVHRDVKPANVMVLSNGGVKILDFGIALVAQTSAARITPQGSLVGTFPYMAPEQFYGAESDALSDIFAYGVTFYKFLTGKHPFQATEMANLMHNIMTMAPPPLRARSPECPEALEQAVMKLLAKDRDLRYQNLDDLRFDLEPVMLELRNASVADLLSHARGLVDSEQFDDAQSRVRQALEIEPGNRTARELRERLQRLIKEKTLRPRIAALITEAREQLGVRNFERAIERFESALRLDKSNQDVSALLEQARAAWARAQHADRLVADASHALDAGDLTAAHETLSEALSADPQNVKAPTLFAALRSKMEARERERHLRDELARVKGLLLIQSFDEAIELLKRLTSEYPASAEAGRLLERARVDQEAHTRRKRFEAAASEAKQLLRNGRYVEALERLRAWRTEFPESAELRDMEAYAADELREQKQADVVARTTAAARAMADQGNFDGALDSLRHALAEYPGAAALRELMQSIASANSARQRQTALNDVSRSAAALSNEGRFSEALERIGAFVRAYGDAAILDSLRRQAEEGLDRQRRAAAIRNLIVEAQKLLDEGRPATAREVLLRATRDFPGAPEFTALLDRAQDRLHEQRRGEDVAKIINEAESFSAALQYDRALELLDSGLRTYSDSERLLRLRDSVESARAAHQKASLVQDAFAQAARLRSQGKLAEALEGVSTALRSVDDPGLGRLQHELETEVERQKSVDELNAAIAGARVSLESDRTDQALRILQAAAERFRGDEQVSRLMELTHTRIAAKSAYTPALPPAAQPPRPEPPAVTVVESNLRIAPAIEVPRRSFRWVWIAVASVASAAAVIFAVFPRKSESKAPVPLRVAIRTSPQGASVSIGDRTCVTPQCTLDLPPGHYQVDAVLKDYQPRHETLIVDAAKPDASLDLTLIPIASTIPPNDNGKKLPSQGTLIVETGEPHASVSIDGAVRGQTDSTGIYSVALDAGSHRIGVEKNGFVSPRPQRIVLKAGDSRVAFKLDPKDAVLIVTGAPGGAELKAGDRTGKTDGSPRFSMNVPARTVNFQVTRAGVSRTIAQQFGPGEEATFEWKNIAPPPAQKPPEPQKSAKVETPSKTEPVLTPAPPVVLNTPPKVALPMPSTPPPPPPPAKDSAGAKPPQPDAKAKAATLFEAGAALLRKSKYQEAIKAFGDAIAVDPASPEPYFGRASASYFLGQFEPAIADYKHVLALDPGFPSANQRLKRAQQMRAAGVLVPGDGISEPKADGWPQADYTREAREAGLQGVVTVEFVVDERGKPQNFSVISKRLGMGLDERAVDAIRRMSFDPARKGLRPVAVLVWLDVPFRLKH